MAGGVKHERGTRRWKGGGRKIKAREKGKNWGMALAGNEEWENNTINPSRRKIH